MRAAEAADAPHRWQHADRAPDGCVTACERMVFPRNPPGVGTMGVMAAALAAMVREPFSRATCPYLGCEHRAGCRADGSPTGWGAS